MLFYFVFFKYYYTYNYNYNINSIENVSSGDSSASMKMKSKYSYICNGICIGLFYYFFGHFIGTAIGIDKDAINEKGYYHVIHHFCENGIGFIIVAIFTMFEFDCHFCAAYKIRCIYNNELATVYFIIGYCNWFLSPLLYFSIKDKIVLPSSKMTRLNTTMYGNTSRNCNINYINTTTSDSHLKGKNGMKINIEIKNSGDIQSECQNKQVDHELDNYECNEVEISTSEQGSDKQKTSDAEKDTGRIIVRKRSGVMTKLNQMMQVINSEAQ